MSVRAAVLLAVLNTPLVACDNCEEEETRICVDGRCLCGLNCQSDDECESGLICAKDIGGEGTCVDPAFKSGGGPECLAGQLPTRVWCDPSAGGDPSPGDAGPIDTTELEVCSCADPCSTDEQCKSLCCFEGLCAPPCACQGGGSMSVCGAEGEGCAALHKGSMSVVILSLLLIGLRRRCT